jgi:hypothetical protein
VNGQPTSDSKSNILTSKGHTHLYAMSTDSEILA